MSFKKLALAAAVAAAPMSALALEPMQDAALSDVTGQDGISISLNTDLVANLIIHDTDGFTGNTNAGALVLNGFGIDTQGGNITLAIDAGDTAATGTAPVLNVAVGIPNNTIVSLGSLDVANSNRDNASGWGVDTTAQVTGVLDLGTVTLGSTNMNIQLGNEPQGNMIVLDTTITGGITLNNFAINDADSGGSIAMGSLAVLDTGAGTDLTVDVGIDATATGLAVTVNQLGAGTGTTANNGIDVRITDLRLGGTAAPIMGDIELVDLNMNGTTITIAGK